MRGPRAAAAAVATLALLARPTSAQEAPLAQLQFDIVGVRLVVDPPALTVPKNIATWINTSLPLPPGTGPETRAAIESLTNGALIEAELRGPDLVPTRIVARPGQPIPIPPLAIPGDYFLDGVRLVRNGQTLLDATTAGGQLATTIPIRVISEVFVTSVTSRPLSLDEIRGRGIVIDEANFRTVNFQVAFNIDGAPFTIDVPAAMPTPEFLRQRPTRETLIQQITTINQSLRGTETRLPPAFDRPGLNFSIAALPFFPVPEDDGGIPDLDIPPITGLVVIPGNVAFLNQFFSVLLMVSNVAPDGTPLELHEARARIVLPAGLDRVSGTFEQPGDDPLRLGRIEGIGIQPEVGVVQRGPDGHLGTADDIAIIQAQRSGEGEFLVEGLKEGSHLFDLEIRATLFGLPSGPVALMGQAAGAVFVRNPTFSVTLSHPRTIRAGEEYDLYATVTNTSQSTANLVRVQLEPLGIGGAQLLSDSSVAFETIAAGQAVTARFRLRAQRTGEVTFSSFTGESAGGIRLTTGIDERGAPLAPNAIVLPQSAEQLPAALVIAAQRVLGQAFSIATAPVEALPPGVLFVRRQTVVDRGVDLALAGERIAFGEPLGRVIQDLLLDWLGNREVDAGFDQILRTTQAGAAFLAEIAAIVQTDVNPVLDYQRSFADTTVARAPHLSIITGANGTAAPVLAVERALGPLTNAAHLSLADADYRARFAVAGVPEADRYSISLTAGGTGLHDIGVVVPGSPTEPVRQLRFPGIALTAGGTARIEIDLSTGAAGALQVDRDANGTVDDQVQPFVDVIVEQPPQLVTVRQLSSSFREGPGNLRDPATYGVLVGVLFDKPVTEASAEIRTNYTIEGNAVSGVQLQASGRLAYLYLRQPIGGLVPRSLTVAGVLDAHGNSLPATTRPIEMTLFDGARVFGQVRDAGGGGVPGSVLRLTVANPPFAFDVSTILTDENGSFDFDLVPRIGDVVLTAQHPVTREIATVMARIRGQGEELLLHPTFIGRGTVRGRVLASDGVTAIANASVALLPGSVLGRRGFETRTDAVGQFVFADAPVGVFTLAATDSRGQFGRTIGVIESGGRSATVDVVLVTQPEAQGRLVGRVFLSNGATPAADFDVYVGRYDRSTGRLEAFDRTSTDASGTFAFARALPPGGHDVVAFNPATQELGVVSASIVALQTTSVSIVLEAVGAVEGVVFNARGEVQPGAIVAGGVALVTADANGFFRIEGVPAGPRTIQAGNPVTRRRGTARVVVLPGQTVRAAITLEARATITGRVLDANGNPVPRATVRLPVVGGFTFVFANNAGVYTLPDLELGEHLIQAPGPTQESLIDFMETNGIDPRNAFTTGDAPPHLGEPPPPSYGDRNAVLAAYQEAVQRFFTVDESLLNGLPMANLGGFGWTKVRLLQDSSTIVADLRFLPQGTVAGRTVDAPGNPIGALTRITALGVSKTGFPTIVELHRTTTDAATGAFNFAGVARFDLATFQTAGVRGGDFTIEAAHPFSPVIASFRSQLNTTTPNLSDVIVRFPSATETNGTISGRVLMPDGVSPAPANTQVSINFGDLQVLTDAEGRFVSLLPIPFGRYTVTAQAPSGLRGQTVAIVPAGGAVNVDIRLLGLGSTTIVARRTTGEAVVGAAVSLERGSFPNDRLAGTTDANGQVRLVNVTEGAFSVTIEEPLTGLTGRAAAAIVRDADVTTPVVLTASGRVTGRFLTADGTAAVPFAQVTLTIGAVRAFTTTAADGGFELRSIPIGRFAIEANDPLTGRLGRASDELVFEGHVVDVTVLQVPRGVVTGVVVHSDGTTVVPAANVQLESSAVVPTRLQATARADGSFRFEGIPAGEFHLRATDPISGFTGDASGRIVRESDVVDLPVTLTPFGAVRVTVRDRTGQTAPNASVTISSGDNFSRTAAVDANGSFTFDFLGVGTYQLLARSLADPGDGGEAVVTIEARQTAETEVSFRGTGSVTIAVVQSDGVTPVASARVTLNARAASHGQPSSRLATTLNGFTDGAGRITFQNVPVGDYFASAEALALAGVNGGQLAATGAAPITTIQLGASGSIAGRVLLPDGVTPATRAVVSLNFTPQSSQTASVQVTTGVAGTFEFTGIPLGSFTVAVLEVVTSGVRTLTRTLAADGERVDLGDVVLDNAGPRISSLNPPDRSHGLPVQPAVEITFNEPVQPASFRTGDNVLLLDGTVPVPLQSLTFSNGNRTVTLRPVQALRSSAPYTLTLRGAPDGPRDEGAGLPLLDAFVATYVTQDVIPPVIVATSPAAGERQVTLESSVRVSFSEPIAAATVSVRDATGTALPGQVALTAGNTAVTFAPAALLQANTTYTATVSSVVDSAGNPLSGSGATFAFTTLDTVAPVITAINVTGTPRPSATIALVPVISGDDIQRIEYLVGSAATIVAAAAPFSANVVVPAGVDSLLVAATAFDVVGNRSLAFTRPIPVTPNAPPTVTLHSVAGVAFATQGQTIEFEAVATDDDRLTSLALSAVGAASFSEVRQVPGNATTFTTRFSIQVPPTAASNGTLTVQAAAVDGAGAHSTAAALALPVRDGISPSVTVPTPVNNAQILPGQPLTVVVDASDDAAVATVAVICNPQVAGCESRTLNPAAASTRQTFALAVPADLHAPATLILAIRATDTSGNTTQIGRALIVPDAVPPALTALTTVSGSARVVAGQVVQIRGSFTDNVGVTALIFETEGALVTNGTTSVVPAVANGAATFAITVPASTPNGSTIIVRARVRDQASNSSAAASLTLAVGDTAAPTLTILSPSEGASFAPGQTVTLNLRVADDSAVQRVVVNAAGVFTTTINRDLTPPVANGDVEVAIALPVATSAGALSLTAEAFDVANNSSGTAPRNVVVADVVSPQVQITSPAAASAIDPRTPLTVVVAASDEVGVTEVAFSATGIVTAAETRAVTPAATTRTESFTVTFTPLPAAGGTLTLGATARDAAGNAGTATPVTVSVLDAVPPDVMQVTPTNGATAVDPQTLVIVEFSEPMDRATLNDTTLALSRGGTAVPATIAITSDDRIATLTPVTRPLAPNATFTLTVGTGARDRAGNALAASRTFTFTTASPDTTGPRVTQIEPANNAVDAALTTPVTVTFTEPIDPATVTAQSFRVTVGGAPVAGTISVFGGDSIVRFTPAEPWATETVVVTELTTAIHDVFGNALTAGDGSPLTAPLTFTFLTGRFSITNPRAGSVVIENSDLLIQARASAALGAASVVFTINGQAQPADTSAPFTVLFAVPSAATTPTLTIVASARNSSGAEIASDTVTVPVSVGLRVTPTLAGVPIGRTTTLRFELSGPIDEDLTIALSAADATLVSFPMNPVVLPAGQVAIDVEVAGVATGNTVLLGTSSRGVAAAIVSVSAVQPGQTLSPASSSIGLSIANPPSIGPIVRQPGDVGTVVVPVLSAPAQAPMAVSITSTNPAVVTATAGPIAAGAQSVAIEITSGEVGIATLIIRVGNEVRALTVIVGTPPPGSIPLIASPPVGFAVIAAPSAGFIVTAPGQTTVSQVQVLSVPATAPVTVTITSSNPDVATATAGSVAVGQQTVDIQIVTGAAGVAVLTIRAGNEVRSLTIFVGAPPAGSTPMIASSSVGVSVTALPFIGRAFAPLGSARTIGVRLLGAPAAADVTVTVTSSDATVATVASPVTIRAGERIAELHITTGAAGTATLTIEGPGIRFEFVVVVGSDPTPGTTPLIVAPSVGVTVIAHPSLGRVVVSPAAPASPTLGLPLLATDAVSDVQVVVTSSAPSIVTVDGGASTTRTIPAGSRVVDLPIATTGQTGAAVLTLEFGGQRRELLIIVGEVPLRELPAVTAPIVGVEVRQ